MVWLCAYLPNLGLELFSRGLEDAGAPLVLVEDNHVVLRNDAAVEAQIAPGASLATAHSICHQVRHFVRDPEAEQTRLGLLAEACYRYGPGISPHLPDALLLEVGSSLRLFKGLYRLKRNLLGLLADAGHQARVGVASTPRAALTFARAGISGSLSARPDARELESHTREGLKLVPLNATELEASVRQRFTDMGIERLGPVLALPRAELGRRFGPALLDYLERLIGSRGDPQPFIAPAETFESALHLLEGISNKQALAFPMQRLAGELSHWLISHQLGVQRLRWGFKPLHLGSNASATVLEADFAQPQQTRQMLLEISRLKLDVSTLPEEVMSITLEAPQVTQWQGRSHRLFPLQGLHADEQPPPGELIDKFRARLGNQACHGIQTRNDHRPEKSWCRTVPGLQKPDNPRRKSAAKRSLGNERQRKTQAPAEIPHERREGARMGRRPLWLLERPRPVPRGELTLLAGPERIETGWWDQSSNPRRSARPVQRRCRDYYIARRLMTDGRSIQCWVYALRDSWFIHGYFS